MPRIASGLLYLVNTVSMFLHSAGVYGSQKREDFSADDVEHYFNYMGMLATEVEFCSHLCIRTATICTHDINENV